MSSRFVQEMQKAERRKLKDIIEWEDQKPLKKIKLLFRVIVSIPSKQLRAALWYFIDSGKATLLSIPSGRVLYREDKQTSGIYVLINGKLTSYMGEYTE